MFFSLITLLTALSMAAVAATFAIYGIVAIFAGLPHFALIMGVVIELGKVVGVSWLYRNWNEPTKIKYFMTPLVAIAMLLTSMGIFGLLSKAHLEQTAPVGSNQLQIERLDQQIQREMTTITDSDTIISQLDQTVQVLINYDRIRGDDGAIAVRESQSQQRDLLREAIDTAQNRINDLEDQKLVLTQELQAIELEVGPVKYIAELLYGNDTSQIEQAVRLVIIAFIFVFDPLAILLLMAANYSLDRRKMDRIKPEPSQEQKTDPPEIPEPSSPSDVANINDNIIPTNQTIADIPLSEVTSGTEEIATTDAYNTNSIDIDDYLAGFEQDIDAQEALATAKSLLDTEHRKPDSLDENTDAIPPLAIDTGNGYIHYNNHLYQDAALRELNPDLFKGTYGKSYGSSFPNIAKKAQLFIRTDFTPHRVFKFDGNKWIQQSKGIRSIIYPLDYIKHLVDIIDKNEYDISLLSNDENLQIAAYLESSAN